MSDDDIEAWEPDFPLSSDPDFLKWRARLNDLGSSRVSIREATLTARDARAIRDLQVVCSPISVLQVRRNIETIAMHHVLLAEIDGLHVGYCTSSVGTIDADPLYLQVVAVAPEAQRRGVGLALLAAAASNYPERDVALATQDDNDAARALNERFAHSVGATIARERLSRFRDSDLGISRGLGYRAWVIRRARSGQQN
ncbi:GNAT family N-acetyltransferase [Microbacterium sp. ISL-59]|nr:GNAT family N-acetyltransferase [Microbacterium sp. ISL-59]